jgi:hypothetical protein
MSLFQSYNRLISYSKRLVKTVSIQQKTEASWGVLLTELEVDDISILNNLQRTRVSFMWCESSCVHLHMIFLLDGTCQRL